MDTDQAWQSALGQLQMEMPKASFDTWVRDTRLVTFDEGIVTIGARNAYARDWLESRLSSTLTRLLMGIMNRDVDVRFVVCDEAGEEVEDKSEPEEKEAGIPVEVVDATRYQHEVQPDRVVVVPGYSLRLLEQGDLTPKQMSLWIGFRQAVYHQWRKGGGVVRNIPHWVAIRFAMMSRASFFREVGRQDDIAAGMIERIPEPDRQFKNGRWYQNANRYRVHMSPRLTRRDAATIENMLAAEASLCATKTEAAQAMCAALHGLAERNPSEYLDVLVEQPGGKSPRGVVEIIRRILGLEGDVPGDLFEAAESLQDRILESFGKIVITHYFLEKLAPALRLTHPQTWAVIALRDHCWFDHGTGTQKDFAIVRGGLKTLASWIGVTKKAVEGWLQNPEFTCLAAPINVTGMPTEWERDGTLVFRVRQEEVLVSDLSGNSETPVLEKVRLESGRNETRIGKSETSVAEKVRLEFGKSETPLNNLFNPIFKPQLTSMTTTTSENANGKSRAAAVVPSSWILKQLFTLNRISGKKRQELRSASAQAFVSWLLYAVSRDGGGIQNPVSFALSQLQQDPQAGAGGAFDQFAALSPAELVRLIRWSFGNATTKKYLSGEEYLNRQDEFGNDLPSRCCAWEQTMGEKNVRIGLLLKILLGEEPDFKITTTREITMIEREYPAKDAA